MNGIKILISPLSWGFGHAGRMIPLAVRLQQRGCEIFFAGEAPLLRMAEKDLPGIRMIEIPGFTIRYSRFIPQYICIFLQLPVMVASAARDHRMLRRLAKQIRPSVIISDNRFGFFHKEIFSVYVTHQLRIPFPAPLRFLEPLADWMHSLIIRRYDLCLVPDYPGDINLSGGLSHLGKRNGIPVSLVYIGPLSRFALPDAYPAGSNDSLPLPSQYICLILSGPEPQRTLLLEKVMAALPGCHLAVLTATPVKYVSRTGITVHYITSPGTATMHRVITGASLIIARAGYTSIMELASLKRGAVLIPTPGQPEQEYLGDYLDGRYGFVTMKQTRLRPLAKLAADPAATTADDTGVKGHGDHLPDPVPLVENALNLLSEQEKK